MAAVHILISGEMAGFKIVPFIATHMKMKKYFHGAMKKKISANQNSPICMKTTDIKLFRHATKSEHITSLIYFSKCLLRKFASIYSIFHCLQITLKFWQEIIVTEDLKIILSDVFF